MPKPVHLSETTLPNTNSRLRARYPNRLAFQEAWAAAESGWLAQLEHHFGELRETHTSQRHTRVRHANARSSETEWRPGDLVVIRDVHRPPGVEGKLRRPYLGPWLVTAVTHNKTLRLSDLDGNPLSRLIPCDNVRLWRASAFA